MESTKLARVSTLLDEAAEEMESLNRRSNIVAAATAAAKIREAQSILTGDDPVKPEDN